MLLPIQSFIVQHLVMSEYVQTGHPGTSTLMTILTDINTQEHLL